MVRKLILAFVVSLTTQYLSAQFNDWKFNQTVEIFQPNDTTLSNFEVLLEFDSKQFVDQGKMNPDLSDLRFAEDCSGNTIYPHWVEEGANTNNTLVWIKVPEVPADGSMFFQMLYGNPAANTASDFNAVWDNPLVIDATNQDANIISPSQSWMNRYDGDDDTLHHFIDTLGTIPANTWDITEFDWIEVKQGARWTFDNKYTNDVDTPLIVADSIMHKIRFFNLRKLKVSGTFTLEGMGYSGGAPASAEGFNIGITTAVAEGLPVNNGRGPGGGKGLKFKSPVGSIPPKIEGNGGFGGAHGGKGGYGTYKGEGEFYELSEPYELPNSGFVAAGSGGGGGAPENAFGADGGGGLEIYSDYLTVKPVGVLNVKGAEAYQPLNPTEPGVGPGGGAGGGLLVNAYQIKTEGLVLAQGGAGGQYTLGGGGGSGGRIQLFHQIALQVSSVNLNGGAPGEAFLLASQGAEDQKSTAGQPGSYFVQEGAVLYEPQVFLLNDEKETPTLTLDVNISTIDVCEGTLLRFTSTEGFEQYIYYNSGVPQQNDTINSFEIVDYLSNDQIKVQGLYNGCVFESSEIPITVKPAEQLTLQDVDPVCHVSDPIDLTEVEPGGTWSGSGIIDANQGVFDPELAGVGNHLVQYVVQNGSDCGKFGSTRIEVYAPNAEFDLASSYCAYPELIDLIADNIGGQFSGSGIIDDKGVFDPSSLTPGSYEITYSVTDNSACTNSRTQRTKVIEVPEAFINGDTEGCVNEELAFSTIEIENGFYRWEPRESIIGTASEFSTKFLLSESTPEISVIVRNEGGCADTANLNLIVNPLPNIVASNDVGVCKGESATISANGGLTYNWSPADFLNKTTGRSVISTPLISTVYEVSGIDANGCVNVDYVRVVADDIKGVESELLTPSLCKGDTAILEFKGFYNYSFSPDPIEIIQNQVLFNSDSIQNKITVIAERNGCEKSEQFPIILNPLPELTSNSEEFACISTPSEFKLFFSNTDSWQISPQDKITVNGNTIEFLSNTPGTFKYEIAMLSEDGCENLQEFVIQVNPAASFFIEDTVQKCQFDTLVHGPDGLFGNYSFSWKPTLGVVDPTERNAQFINTFTQTYTLEVSSGGAACSSSKETTVKVLPSPELNVPSKAQACLNDTFIIEASGSNNYRWEGEGILAGGLSSKVTVYQASPSEISVTAVSPNRCETTKKVNLEFYQDINVRLGADTSICIGDSVYYIAKSDVAPISYRFDNPEIANQLNDSSILVVGNASGTISVYAESLNGCQDSTGVLIDVIELPQLTVEKEISTCLDENYTLSASGQGQFVWFPDSLVVGNNNQPSVTFSAAFSGNHDVFVTLQDPITTCVNKADIDFEVFTLPEISIATPIEYCAEDTFTFSPTVTSNGIQTVTWEPISYFNDNSKLNAELIHSESGVISLSITDTNSCVNSVNKPFQVNPLPKVEIEASKNPVCPDQAETLIAKGGDDLSNYTWFPSTFFSSTSDSIAEFSTNMITVVGVIIENSKGCIDTGSILIGTLIPEIPIIETSADSLCPDAELDIQIQEGQNFTNLSWSPSANFTSPNSAETTYNPDFISGNEEVFFLTYTDTNGCASQLEESVYLHYQFDPLISGDSGICPGFTTTFQVANPNYAAFNWQPNTEVLTGSNSSIAELNPNQSIDYSLELTDIYKCIYTYNIPITVHPEPFVNAGKDRLLYDGIQVVHDGFSDGIVNRWLWYGDTIANSLNFVFIPELQDQSNPKEQAYLSLYSVNQFGCKNSDSSLISVLSQEKVQFPNAISPNGDGQNDVFSVTSDESIEILDISIFDRWGNVVFEQSGPNIQFLGKDLNGEELPIDTYPFYINIRRKGNKEETRSGNITLIR